MDRVPPPKDHGRYGDESAACSHLVRELMLIEREIHSSEAGENPGDRHREIPDAFHADSNALGRLRMFTSSADPQAERGFVKHERHGWRDNQSEPQQGVVEAAGLDVPP